MRFSRIPVELFYSYSHKDEEFRDELETHLASLKREGLVEVWHDRRIEAGEDWNGEIAKRLNTADIILLLVSANFLASDYCYDLEVKRALERHANGTARVVPVILKPCDWKSTPFGPIQSLPKDAKPISRWDDRDEAFLNVVTGLRLVIQEAVYSKDDCFAEAKDLNEPGQVGSSTSRPPLELVSRTSVSSIPTLFRQCASYSESCYPIEILSRTGNSIIEKYCIAGEDFVLKKTKKSLCYFSTLQKTVGKAYRGREKGFLARVATPIEVGIDSEFVWELHPFYDGISLSDLIRKYGPVFRGSDIGALHNSLFAAISQMHKDNILHRDLSPSNILMVTGSEFLILDCAFCCEAGLPQDPVSTFSYTAPEQSLGQATFVSDYYSIAATMYFFTNGYAPNPNEDDAFKRGLERMDLPGFKTSSSFMPSGPGILGVNRTISNLYECLLHPQASHRPASIAEVLLDEITYAEGRPKITQLLDLGKFGYLIVASGDARLIPNRAIKQFLRVHGDRSIPEIRDSIRLILDS